jgi:hypothetical protein
VATITWRAYVVRPLPLLLILSAALTACGDKNPASPIVIKPEPAAINAVTVLPNMSLGAMVEFSRVTAENIRVRYQSTDGLDNSATPWEPASSERAIVLGLRADTEYSLWIESQTRSDTVSGPPLGYITPSLPADISELRMRFDGSPSSGYSLANISSTSGHGYAVAFDALGSLRWYRDFGATVVFFVRQQVNGSITAYVGPSDGFEDLPGLFVEVTPEGDSVRAITARGSPHTDPHDLLTIYDRRGGLLADYLFGYELTKMDRSPQGIDVVENVAYHQILRISAAGIVDTLINGIDDWDLTDAIEPPPIPDLDHPNSIDFDLDGGIVVSYRSLSAIVKVNQDTRQILWQLGGTRNEFTFVNDPLGAFDGQHSVRVLGNGHLLIFDNGWNHTPQMSRAVEYALDTVAKTATMVWQYRANPPVFNDFTGSAQRLANGNTVVAFTRHGTVDEVGPDGTRLSRGVIEISPGVSALPYRVTRINNLYGFANP